MGQKQHFTDCSQANDTLNMLSSSWSSLWLDQRPHPATKIPEFPAFLLAQLPLNTWRQPRENTEQKVELRPLQKLPVWI